MPKWVEKNHFRNTQDGFDPAKCVAICENTEPRPAELQVKITVNSTMSAEDALKLSDAIRMAALTLKDLTGKRCTDSDPDACAKTDEEILQNRRMCLAQVLDGRNAVPGCFDDVRQIARNEGLVIIAATSENNMELHGALEADTCAEWGKAFSVSADSISDDPERYGAQIIAIYYGVVGVTPAGAKGEFMTSNGEMIPWCYATDLPHETFLLYKDNAPYCRGMVLSKTDLKRAANSVGAR